VDLAASVVRRRGFIAAAWLALAGVLLPEARRVEERLEVSARILGSESSAVEDALADRFASPFAHNALLVLSGVPAPDREEGRHILDQVLKALADAPGVLRTFSYADTRDPYFLGKGGGTFVLVGLRAAGGRVDQLMPSLRAATERAGTSLRPRFPHATLRWTGEAPINYDLWHTTSVEAHAAEKRTLPLTLLLLLAAFRTFWAALLPIVAGVLSVELALGAAWWLSGFGRLSILIVNVVSMLGLALGIDYALLTVSRFRESLALGRSPEAAASEAARCAGGTVALSGAAVLVGFLTLLLVPLNELRSTAAGGLLVVLVSVLFATTLLPGLLAWLGPRLNAWPLTPRSPSRTPGNRFRAWARHISNHPFRVLGLTLPPLLLLAAQTLRLNPQNPGNDWLPPSTESAHAVKDLEAMERAGIVESIRVVLELPEGTSALSVAGWEATRRLGEALARDARVARVQSLRALAGDDLAVVALLPGNAKRMFLSEEGDAALLELVPKEGVPPGGLTRLVRELRKTDVPALTGLPGSRLRVGGLPAFNADYEDAVSGRLFGVVGLVVGGTLVALFIGFRSCLIPVKAVALNLLSVCAAFGALVLVFQDGHGASLLGLAGPVDGVFPIVPPLVFCTVFGLSMDYEVFLVARVAEARRGGMEEAEALAEGIARTGGVITSAAAIMIAVFAAFTLGEFLIIKMLGFALSVAIFLDATVIRLAVGPALLRLAGRWNWWPDSRK
jgi:putative drug exporter of the RND superfamily